MKRRELMQWAAALGMPTLSSGAWAQDKFPSKPMVLVLSLIHI